MNRALSLFLIIIAFISCTNKPQEEQAEKEASNSSQKIITAGGTLTEIVYALGHGGDIIATDRTSTYPNSMQELPSIGYRNQIQAEGILSLSPDQVIIEEGYLNNDVVSQLKNSGKSIHEKHKPQNPEEAVQLITDLGLLLNEQDKAQSLIVQLQQDLAKLSAMKEGDGRRPSVAFIMSHGPEMVFLAGRESFAEGMITLAGGQMVAVDFTGLKPLSPEALPALNPDYILLFESGFQAAGGKEGLKSIQGITETTAWRSNQLIAMDGHYLSGFGPRLGQAAIELFQKIHP
ncbi:hypothetical protein GCM10007049_05160 [Echinicola pacifica]|uniref:Fe/B12 periplasmic-binding domain-containing protein n=1 Tax=Echinicola pacifica TaxID=346377 RepID=A0A918PMS9_9BACT|nr:ABC transporter substrate-binding protein [Echinicola pacifica]GGZ15903.1 hypothetical protein GCM10007049_05160 [Echinicola pacifica]